MDLQNPHPLQLPEIILRIGRFIPFWFEDPDSLKTVNLYPSNFLKCLSVNRLWRKTLLPLFWIAFDDRVFEEYPRLPRWLVRQYSHNLRFCEIHFDQQPLQYLNDIQLQELTLCQWVAEDAATQIVLQSPGLRLLSWDCSLTGEREMREQDYKALYGLNRLRVLRLQGWRLDHRKLLPLFSHNHYTLQELSLEDMGGFDDPTSWTQLFSLTLLEIDCRWNQSNSALAHLVGFCPALKSLALNLYPECDLVLIASMARQSCLELDSLICVEPYNHFQSTTFLKVESHAQLIRDMTHRPNQLKRYKMAIETLDETILNALLAHSESLESIELFICGDQPFIFTNANTLLERCPNLKQFCLYNYLVDWGLDLGIEVLKGDWACKGLEILELDGFACRMRNELNDGADAGLEEEEERTEGHQEETFEQLPSEQDHSEQSENRPVEQEDRNSNGPEDVRHETESEHARTLTTSHGSVQESESSLQQQGSSQVNVQQSEGTLSNSNSQEHEPHLQSCDLNEMLELNLQEGESEVDNLNDNACLIAPDRLEQDDDISRSDHPFSSTGLLDSIDQWSTAEQNQMEVARLQYRKIAPKDPFQNDTILEGWRLCRLWWTRSPNSFLATSRGKRFKDTLLTKLNSLPRLKQFILNTNNYERT
ncbi:hypothetical protein BGW38_007209 [Lunasporangiospora selenospora]|uniref:Uncharacterized protein n=1 Tax=Lunasporangiospora selenospora TaxID=979761 RepID=A0A9P6KGL9_9FUNG|nr:hypothetical protein BGW38_007209 [Lunasporangiospora selenospora]